MLKITQYIIAFALVWAFMPVVEDVMVCIARFFFRLGEILHLVPDIF